MGAVKLSALRKLPGYSDLSPAGRDNLDQVFKKTSRLSKYVAPHTYAVSDSLAKLLQDGRLESKTDSEGETLLKNLQDLVDNPKLGKQRKNEIFGWTATHLAFPDETFAQVPGKGTCAPTTIAVDLLQDNPAEFVRLVDGLADKERQVTLANGDPLKRAVRSFSDDSGSGSPVAKILQASFMDYARPDEQYRISSDSFAKEDDTGLLPDQVERLTEALHCNDVELRRLASGELAYALQEVDQTLPSTIRWSDDSRAEEGSEEKKHSYHMVLLTGCDSQYVYYRNPWGYYSDEYQGPACREVLENGSERIPLKEFLERQEYVVVPKSLEPGKTAPLPAPEGDTVTETGTQEKKRGFLGWLFG